MSKVIDETGNKYGELIVIERDGSIKGLAAWKCLCSCGKYVTIIGAALRTGNTKSCGCQKYKGFCEQRKIQNQSSIKIGERFGKLIVIKELDLRPHGTKGHNRRWYLCQCDCGNICEAMGNNLKTGNKISCGCIKSKGEYKIEELLKNSNIEYKTEVIDEQLENKYNRKLRFDFGIYKNGVLQRYIEFDGNQHKYGMQGGIWSKTETLDTIQERDNIKNVFCKENNIPLVRIPAFKIKNLLLEDILGEKYCL